VSRKVTGLGRSRGGASERVAQATKATNLARIGGAGVLNVGGGVAQKIRGVKRGHQQQVTEGPHGDSGTDATTEPLSAAGEAVVDGDTDGADRAPITIRAFGIGVAADVVAADIATTEGNSLGDQQVIVASKVGLMVELNNPLSPEGQTQSGGEVDGPLEAQALGGTEFGVAAAQTLDGPVDAEAGIVTFERCELKEEFSIGAVGLVLAFPHLAGTRIEG